MCDSSSGIFISNNYIEEHSLGTLLITPDSLRVSCCCNSYRASSIPICNILPYYVLVACFHSNSYFSSLDVMPTVEHIHHTFGPTLPGGKSSLTSCLSCDPTNNRGLIVHVVLLALSYLSSWQATLRASAQRGPVY